MMKQDHLFTVKLKYTILPRVAIYGQLEGIVHNAFINNSLHIDNSSPILKGEKKNVWRIISENDSNIDAYKLVLTFDSNDDTDCIEVYDDTISGLPKTLWDFKVFTSEIHSPESRRKIYYTGETRKNLSKKRKLKWDFFFRPDEEVINSKFDKIIYDCKKEINDSVSNLENSQRNIFLLIGASILTYLGIQYLSLGYSIILCLIAVIFSFIFLLKILRNKVSLNLGKLKKEINRLQKYLSKFKEEKQNILRQLEEITLPKNNEIVEWLDSEISHMEEESRNKYVFSDEIKKKDTLCGFGIYQPEFAQIYKSFIKKIDTFFGFRVVEESLVYSGLYIVFIFQTDEKVCISKFFYDFVLSKKYREENLEYHYSDLVGIAVKTKLVNNPFKGESIENSEINTIWMSFTDSNNVEIAIIDKDTSESIAERLLDGEEQNGIEDLGFLDDDFALKDDSNNLVMNKALTIIRNIKEQKSKLSQ